MPIVVHLNLLPMKHLTILFFLVLAGTASQSQEYYFGLSTTAASSTQYRQPAGLYGGYCYSINQDLKWHIDVLANFSYRSYDRITFDNNTGQGYFVNKIQPQSWWLALSSHLNWEVFARGCLVVSVGPMLSINYFISNELIQDIPTNTQTDRTYRRQHNNLNRPGFGGNLEFELEGLFRKRVSIITSISPQVIFFGKAMVSGGDEGAIVANISRLGLRYKL